MLYTLYRISDGGNIKNKLKHADKLYCLKNLISIFGTENLFVFTDNCSDETIANLNSLSLNVITLENTGNANSFKKTLDYAILNFKDMDYVYFVEDDYLHLENARQVLLEGLGIADYVTLYDNPDKYIDFKSNGYNHYVINHGEESKVFLTQTSHWRLTSSTTMTFACRINTLKNDSDVWNFFKTQDYLVFQRLTRLPLKLDTQIKVLKNKLHRTPFFNKQYIKIIYHHLKHIFLNKNRLLITCIPGKATHIEVDFLSPLTNWNKI